MTGYAQYRPIGLKTEYTHVDLEKQLVKAIVKYKGKKIITVTVDLLADSIQKVGGLEEVSHLEVHGINEHDTLIMIKQMAEF
ncbi:hypothetical protein [Cohnella lupini]|uniref:Uncharacterized protein n=1 Tax=Cohnella lupini TaxID=1294267 RepID=A0A3D9HNP5_9BACL|nr:hypothetical protein [Cohnella lupini]RED51098.1 hypothetical protein DFP95_1533 [Cohnella lupini]